MDNEAHDRTVAKFLTGDEQLIASAAIVAYEEERHRNKHTAIAAKDATYSATLSTQKRGNHAYPLDTHKNNW